MLAVLVRAEQDARWLETHIESGEGSLTLTGEIDLGTEPLSLFDIQQDGDSKYKVEVVRRERNTNWMRGI